MSLPAAWRDFADALLIVHSQPESSAPESAAPDSAIPNNSTSDSATPDDSTREAQSLWAKGKIATFYDFWAVSGGNVPWNWGMWQDSLHDELAQILPGFDEGNSDGHSEQLYFYTLKRIAEHGAAPRKVLEVGCGHGAGLNFLSRLDRNMSFVGVDLSKAAVDRGNMMFRRPGLLSYLHGDAENLPFANAEFDAVINVESSHNYPDLGRFLSEVARVLRPGGVFSHVDIFTDERRAVMRKCKDTETALAWVDETDISRLVQASIRRRMDPKSKFRKELTRTLPWPLRAPWLGVGALAMRNFGAKFLDTNQKRVAERNLEPGKWMARLRLGTLITSYRHTLAVKAHAT